MEEIEVVEEAVLEVAEEDLVVLFYFFLCK